jgi:AmmeMemoRadiSam system protein A
MNFKDEIDFSKDSRIAILDLARESIIIKLAGKTLSGDVDFEHKDDILGVFVTLRKHEQLRGCIGSIFPSKPLKESVRDMAVSSAVNDPRFLPVELEELDDLSIEVSVLAPFSEVDNIEEIEIGKHGLMVEHLGKRGVFLPEVALNQGWDILTYLEQLCCKAGLATDVLKDKPRLLKFDTIKISDDKSQRSKS